MLRASTQHAPAVRQGHLKVASIASARAFSWSTPRAKPRLVILGSGWGGYEVLRGIDKSRWSMFSLPLHAFAALTISAWNIDVTIVSPNSYFNFTPLLASCAVGTLEFRTAVEPVSQSIMNFARYTDAMCATGEALHAESGKSVALFCRCWQRIEIPQNAYQAWCDSIGMHIARFVR